MSVQAVSWVLDCSKSKGNERCVLIALANRFDAKEPERCWPGVDTIAREANVSSRTVSRCLDGLVKLDELLVFPGMGGSTTIKRRDRRTNLYVFPALTDWRPDDMTGCHPVQKGDTTAEHERDDRSRHSDMTLLSRDTTGDSTETLTGKESSNAVARLDDWPDDFPQVARNSGLLPVARELCELLESTLIERGYRNSIGKSRSKRWLLDMEALLRVDERKVEQVRWVIRWLDRGEDRVSKFWRRNVRSPDKLRAHWDRLREEYAAQREQGRSKRSIAEEAAARAAGVDPDEARAATDQLVRQMFGNAPAEPRSALTSDVIDVESRGA